MKKTVAIMFGVALTIAFLGASSGLADGFVAYDRIWWIVIAVVAGGRIMQRPRERRPHPLDQRLADRVPPVRPVQRDHHRRRPLFI